MRLSIAGIIVTSSLITGCAGQLDYNAPSTYSQPSNIKTVNTPFTDVWKSAVPELGKKFFVINNIDKASGLINISYSGDPKKYVDCGRIISYVKNARGERTYNFPAAQGQQTFEVLNNNGLFLINRSMELEGRVNLIFEDIDSNSTRVSANIKYIVTRKMTGRNLANKIPHTTNDSIQFNSGSSASFPAAPDGRATTCVPTGSLEESILSAIR